MNLSGRWRGTGALAVVLAGLAALVLALWQPRYWQRFYHHGLRLVPVAEGLDTPWAIAFLPDGRLLVTERPGRLRIVETDGRLGAPLVGLPAVRADGEGGLMDVVPAPDFARSGQIYWSYTEAGPGDTAGTTVARARLDGQQLREVEIVYRQPPVAGPPLHFGSRLRFGPDGRLFVTLGDRWRRDEAQSPASAHGKLLRLEADGRVPADNPFADQPGARPELWTLGHRNVQGLAVHPTSGALWASEHGPDGGDEINLIRRGLNYGWPVVSHGCEYKTCAPIGEGRAKPGMEPPRTWFGPVSVPPTGMAFLTGTRYPRWVGQLFVGTLYGQALMRLTLDGDEVVARQPMWLGPWNRVRDVKQGPDGWLYVAVENPRGAILRLER
jgi:aldose sugar dehydrogenase